MATISRTTDSKARVTLPNTFANSTVIIEEVSATELRVRKAPVGADDKCFREECPTKLSDRDRDRFLAMPVNPRRAVAEYKKRRHG